MAREVWRSSLASLMHRSQLLVQQQDTDTHLTHLILDDLLDEVLTFPRPVRGGSRKGKRPNIDRRRLVGEENIYQDYFAANATYSRLFRRRFRMRKPLFMRIVEGILETDSNFQQKWDCSNLRGLSTLQKAVAATRILCCGSAYDQVDKYVRIGESTASNYLGMFCAVVIKKFGPEYLREPSQEDYDKQLQTNAERGFPRMFGSVDCTHWIWKNCPVYAQGQYQNRKGSRSIILEAVATQDLRIWHHHFGIPGSNNDINVIDRSPLLGKMMKGNGEKVEYTINGRVYYRSYLLADSIYPDYTCFVKTYSEPAEKKYKFFAKNQESVRKDVERAFGVLKARFAILANPCRFWREEKMKIVVQTCIILYNMIVVDEIENPLTEDEQDDSSMEPCERRVRNPLEQRDEQEVAQGEVWTFQDLRTYFTGMVNMEGYLQLRRDLVEHQWALHGSRHSRGNI